MPAPKTKDCKKIKELLKLSTAELLPNGVRDSGYVDPTARRRELPYLVYPSKAVLVWKKRSPDLDGREDTAGQLWTEQRIEFDPLAGRRSSKLAAARLNTFEQLQQFASNPATISSSLS
jgi:hypothetical protein